jgi:spermidine synthase
MIFNFRRNFITHLSLLSTFQLLNVSIAEIGGSPKTTHAGLPVLDDVPKNRIGELEPSIGFYQAIELVENSLLYSKQSKYQAIEVHQTKFFGKMLVLDGVIQLTERDADSYNEMMAHVPMFQHVNPKRVLVVGGGDGYVLKEVLKHPSVERVDHVDLDGDVIETCEKHFPQWGDAWKDPRANLHICDGAKYVRDTPDNFYDVIIQDSSDPWIAGEDGEMMPLPSGVLYEEEHICQLYRILKPNGVLNIQAESFNVPTSLEGIITWRKTMETCGFERSRYGSIHTSSYPTGQIGLLLGEKQPSASSKSSSVLARYRQIVSNGDKTSYYHPPLQRGCFEVPLWVHNSIYGEEDTSDLLCKLTGDKGTIDSQATK